MLNICLSLKIELFRHITVIVWLSKIHFYGNFQLLSYGAVLLEPQCIYSVKMGAGYWGQKQQVREKEVVKSSVVRVEIARNVCILHFFTANCQRESRAV